MYRIVSVYLAMVTRVRTDTHTQMPFWFEKDSDQGLTAAGSIGVAQGRIGRAQRVTPPIFGLVAVALSRLGRASTGLL